MKAFSHSTESRLRYTFSGVPVVPLVRPTGVHLAGRLLREVLARSAHEVGAIGRSKRSASTSRALAALKSTFMDRIARDLPDRGRQRVEQ